MKALQSMQSFIDVDLKSVDDFDASGLKVKCILKCAEWMRALREFPLNEVCLFFNFILHI